MNNSINNMTPATRLRKGDYIVYISGSTGLVKPARILLSDKRNDFVEVETATGEIAELTMAQCFKSNRDEFENFNPSNYAQDIDEVEEPEVEELDDEELDDEDVEGGNGKVKKRYADKYKQLSGRRDNNDPVACQLREMSIEDVYKTAAKAAKMSVKDLQAKYGHLNKGMQRMNLGNIVRRAASSEE
jgi:hypothetical protein